MEHYIVNIYKGKFLEKSYSTTQENFKNIHTALMELSKEKPDLKWSFEFDGVDRCIHMDRDVADNVFGHLSSNEKLQQPTADAVNHPTHYNSHPSGIECITITRHHDFNTGNAIKYLWRCGLKIEKGKTAKEMEIKDLKKAVWYINAEIDLLQNSQE